MGQPVKGHTIRWGQIIASADFDPRREWPGITADASRTRRYRRLAMLWLWRLINLCMNVPAPGLKDSLAGDAVSAFLNIDLKSDAHVVQFRPRSLSRCDVVAIC